MKGRTLLGCCSKGWTVGGTPMGSGCLDRQGPGVQQGMGGSVGSGEAGVTPVGERVPRAGVLVGEAGLRPCAATPRGSPLGAGQKGELRVPLGQEGGSWVLLHRVVKHPPGEGSPRSPPSLTRYRHQCGTPHLSLSGGAITGPPSLVLGPLPVQVPAWDPNSSPGPPSQSGFLHPGAGANMATASWDQTPVPVWVLVWERPHPSAGSHPGTGLSSRHGYPYGISVPVLSPYPSMAAITGSPIPVQDTPFPNWIPIPAWVLE